MNESRGRLLGGLFARAEGLVRDLEVADPQMHAVKRIIEKVGPTKGACYVVGVALVSYMLSRRGEEHWALAAEYAGDDVEKALLRFVRESPSLSRFRLRREKRVMAYARRVLPQLLSGFEEYARDLARLWRLLSSSLGADPSSKTLAFAVKMFYYAAKASGVECRLPAEVPIPVDYRVCLVSLTSRLVEGWRGDLREGARRLRSSGSREVRNAWSLVSKVSGLAPLELDTVLWLVGGAAEEAGFSARGALGLVEGLLRRRLSFSEETLLLELLSLLRR